MKKNLIKLISGLVLGALLSMVALAAAAPAMADMPMPPTIYNGTVTASGGSPLSGASVVAKVNGSEVGSATTDSSGKYVMPIPGGPTESIASGNTISFWVNNVNTGQTATYGSGSTQVNLTGSASAPASSALALATASLYTGTIGVGYSQTVAASGGSGSYTFSITSGTLPQGLTLGSGGAITGTPTTSGTSSFTVQVTDSAQGVASRTLSITVNTPPTTTGTSTTTTSTGTQSGTSGSQTGGSSSTGSQGATSPGSQSPSMSQTSAPTGSPSFADYSYSELTVAPQVAKAGDQITATVRVMNSGNGTESTNVLLKVNDMNAAQKIVQVPPGQSQLVDFTFSEDTAGTYTVAVGGQTASIEVQAAPAASQSQSSSQGNSMPVMVIIGAGILLIIVLVIMLIARRRQDY